MTQEKSSCCQYGKSAVTKGLFTLGERKRESQFFKNFWRHKSFLWGHQYPFLDFWQCLLWVSKPEWAALFILGGAICVTCSRIHLWCNTCRPLSSQHGSWGNSLPCTCEKALVGLYCTAAALQWLFQLWSLSALSVGEKAFPVHSLFLNKRRCLFSMMQCS